MNIITTIQAALTALNSNAEVFLLSKERAENEELNHTKPVIIVYPTWRESNTLTQGLELAKVRTYSMVFKTLDEWDNSDSNQLTSYNSSTTVDRIEDMTKLCDSVFSYITLNNGSFPEIRKKLLWSIKKPLVRENNGTMSGIEAELIIEFTGERVCNYGM